MSTYLGQNFLHDTKVQQYIAQKIALLCSYYAADTIVEIWPGKWAITKRIKDITTNFFVVEKDRTMQAYLEKIIGQDQIIFGDILDTDVLSGITAIQTKKTIVVGNLPYYITSPILRKFFACGEQIRAGWFFMMQKEVWDKIHDDAKKKSYLWWLLHHSYDVIYTKTVAAKSFRPAPKVQSCLIRIVPKRQVWQIAFERLLAFLDIFAPYSRKTMWKIAKMSGLAIVMDEHVAKKRLEDCCIEDVIGIVANNQHIFWS
jgi:16S rRNA (adenine1518-N6/adenine1519-N6)-dimethyltransferase